MTSFSKGPVSVADCPNYDTETVNQALTRVLSPIGGLAFVKPGMRVVIKVNLVSSMKPEDAATTHPAVLCALVRMLILRGAQVVIGDSPGGFFNDAALTRVYQVTGMHEAEAVGALLNRNYQESEARFPSAAVLKSFQYTSYLDDADVIINFSKLKSHGMIGMSAAAKNMFGAIPGLTKPQYHYLFPNSADFARMLVDIDEYFRPKILLCICDAVVAMEGNGPTKGTPKPIGALLASVNPHALDFIAAQIIGLDAVSIPTLQAAQERGLIPERWEEITLLSEMPLEHWKPKQFEHLAVRNSLLFADNGKNPIVNLFSRIAGRVLRSVPAVKADECIGCEKCARQCPAHAIVMRNGKPTIHRSPCIRCFCCQEFCPTGAMKVRKPLVTRLFRK